MAPKAALLLAASACGLAGAVVSSKACDPFASQRFEWQLVDNRQFGIAHNVSRFREKLAHFRGQLLLLGGMSTQIALNYNDVYNMDAWLSDVWSSSSGGESWTRLASNAYGKRLFFETLNSPEYLPNKQLFVAGGITDVNPPFPTREVLVTSDGAHWAVADWTLPLAMWQFSITLNPSDGRIYVGGGGSATIWSIGWDAKASGVWQSFTGTSVGPRVRMTMFSGFGPGSLYVFGGNVSVPAAGSGASAFTGLSGASSPSATVSPQPVVADVLYSSSSGYDWQRRAYIGPVPGTTVTSAYGRAYSDSALFVFTVRRDKVSLFCSDDGGYRWAENPVIDDRPSQPWPMVHYDGQRQISYAFDSMVAVPDVINGVTDVTSPSYSGPSAVEAVAGIAYYLTMRDGTRNYLWRLAASTWLPSPSAAATPRPTAGVAPTPSSSPQASWVAAALFAPSPEVSPYLAPPEPSFLDPDRAHKAWVPITVALVSLAGICLLLGAWRARVRSGEKQRKDAEKREYAKQRRAVISSRGAVIGAGGGAQVSLSPLHRLTSGDVPHKGHHHPWQKEGYPAGSLSPEQALAAAQLQAHAMFRDRYPPHAAAPYVVQGSSAMDEEGGGALPPAVTGAGDDYWAGIAAEMAAVQASQHASTSHKALQMQRRSASRGSQSRHGVTANPSDTSRSSGSSSGSRSTASTGSDGMSGGINYNRWSTPAGKTVASPGARTAGFTRQPSMPAARLRQMQQGAMMTSTIGGVHPPGPPHRATSILNLTAAAAGGATYSNNPLRVSRGSGTTRQPPPPAVSTLDVTLDSDDESQLSPYRLRGRPVVEQVTSDGRLLRRIMSAPAPDGRMIYWEDQPDQAWPENQSVGASETGATGALTSTGSEFGAGGPGRAASVAEANRKEQQMRKEDASLAAAGEEGSPAAAAPAPGADAAKTPQTAATPQSAATAPSTGSKKKDDDAEEENKSVAASSNKSTATKAAASSEASSPAASSKAGSKTSAK